MRALKLHGLMMLLLARNFMMLYMIIYSIHADELSQDSLSR